MRSNKSDEVAAIQETMMRLTWGEYEISEPMGGLPTSKPVRWLLICTDFEEPGVTNASAIWEDEVGDVWIESALIGTVSRWIEQEYGVMQPQQKDYSALEDASVDRYLSREFPLVAERLMNYIRIASEISEKRNTPLRIIFKKAVAAIFLNCRIPAAGSDLGAKLERIKAAVATMNETFDSFNAYEASRAKEHPETILIPDAEFDTSDIDL